MQFLVKLVAAIVPYLLRFMDKHSDEYLEALSKRIIAFIGGNIVATIKFYIINSQGEPVANSVAGFNIDNFGFDRIKSFLENTIIVMASFTEVLRESCKAAGKVLMDGFGKAAVYHKDVRDLVTESDRKAQKAVRDILAEAFPTHIFVGEETIDDLILALMYIML